MIMDREFALTGLLGFGRSEFSELGKSILRRIPKHNISRQGWRRIRDSVEAGCTICGSKVYLELLLIDPKRGIQDSNLFVSCGECRRWIEYNSDKTIIKDDLEEAKHRCVNHGEIAALGVFAKYFPDGVDPIVNDFNPIYSARLVSRSNADKVFQRARFACSICTFRGYIELEYIKPASMGGIGTPQNLFTACPWCKRLMMLSGDCISVDQLVLVKQEWENKSYPGKHIIVAAIAHKHGSVIASDIMDALNLSNALKYDVALSFASEDRGKARALAELLTEAGYSVFYDEYAKSELWGKNLYDHLVRVYKDESRFCVVFASTHYQSKVWTNHERQAAQARALKDKKEYLLPIRIDDTEIPGLPATIGYIDWHTTTPNEVFQLLREKLEMPD